MSNLEINKNETEDMKSFKEKVSKILFMKELGMLSEEDLKLLKQQLLNDIDNTSN